MNRLYGWLLDSCTDQATQRVVAEGGGTRLFVGPVKYTLLELRP